MKFSISLTFDAVSARGKISEDDFNRKSAIVIKLADDLNVFLKNGNYGKDILEYQILLNIINMPKAYEHLFKDFRPKLTEYKVRKNKHTGEEYEIKGLFNYSVKIQGDLYNKYITLSDEESKKILATEIFTSFSKLDKLPKNVKDFDKENFKKDVFTFFKNKNLIN